MGGTPAHGAVKELVTDDPTTPPRMVQERIAESKELPCGGDTDVRTVRAVETDPEVLVSTGAAVKIQGMLRRKMAVKTAQAHES